MTDLLARIASTPTLHAAFDRVRNNHGCAGADGVSLADFERALEACTLAIAPATRCAMRMTPT